jgi:hypothetical protein
MLREYLEFHPPQASHQVIPERMPGACAVDAVRWVGLTLSGPELPSSTVVPSAIWGSTSAIAVLLILLGIVEESLPSATIQYQWTTAELLCQAI